MDKIKQLINKSILQEITKLLEQLACDHEWESQGLGYKCNKCGYYTGTNKELNKLIEGYDYNPHYRYSQDTWTVMGNPEGYV